MAAFSCKYYERVAQTTMDMRPWHLATDVECALRLINWVGNDTEVTVTLLGAKTTLISHKNAALWARRPNDGAVIAARVLAERCRSGEHDGQTEMRLPYSTIVSRFVRWEVQRITGGRKPVYAVRAACAAMYRNLSIADVQRDFLACPDRERIEPLWVTAADLVTPNGQWYVGEWTPRTLRFHQGLNPRVDSVDRLERLHRLYTHGSGFAENDIAKYSWTVETGVPGGAPGEFFLRVTMQYI